MERIESLPRTIRNRIRHIYDQTAIDRRHSCIADYGKSDASSFDFFPGNWSLKPAPSTADRNKKYREAVLPLAEDAATRALQQSSCSGKEITHLITVSCTGFFAPGIDIELVKRLGLSPSTQRTMIGFMGCYAAFNALRVAHSFCVSQPSARVLVVCAELCTLHFQVDDSLESAVVNALFSDGAAATVLSSRTAEEARGAWSYAGGHVVLDGDSMEHMTWDVGDTGFTMGLSSRVPAVIAENLPEFMEDLLRPHDLCHEGVDFWAIHPGGRAIVEKARDTLQLSPEDVEPSLRVLREHGNMSSPTILFVLKEILEHRRDRETPGARGAQAGVAMAFGPGLTLEGAVFRRVGESVAN